MARQNFVFVHGGWHSARHWSKVTDLLVAAGHHAMAIDLPGCGANAVNSRIADLRLADYSDAVAETVSSRASAGGPVTLVGHSLGGPTVTRAAETVPESVKRLVYISAYLPAKLPNVVAYRTLPESSTTHTDGLMNGDPSVTGVFSIKPPAERDDEYLEKIRQAYYHDVSADDFREFARHIETELPANVVTDDARGTAKRWGAIPRAFIRCTEDRAIPLALQDRMIAEADGLTPGNKFAVHSLPSSHSPFASMPGALAALLAGI